MSAPTSRWKTISDPYFSILREFGGAANAYLPTPLGARYVDSLAGGIAREAKYGYVEYSSRVASQIAKDAALLQSGSLQAVEWVFYRSASTGIGPSPAVERALRQHGIRILFR